MPMRRGHRLRRRTSARALWVRWAPPVDQHGGLRRGTRVVLNGLRSASHLNGRLGIVVGAADAEDSSRIAVKVLARTVLEGVDPGATRALSVKRENLHAHGEVAEGDEHHALVVCAPSEALATQYGLAVLAALRAVAAAASEVPANGDVLSICAGAGAPELAAALRLERSPIGTGADAWAAQAARECFIAGLRAVPRAIAIAAAAAVSPGKRQSMRTASQWLAAVEDASLQSPPGPLLGMVVGDAAPATSYSPAVIRTACGDAERGVAVVGAADPLAWGVLASSPERLAACAAGMSAVIAAARVSGVQGVVRR